jgi:hypothetical protein
MGPKIAKQFLGPVLYILSNCKTGPGFYEAKSSVFELSS